MKTLEPRASNARQKKSGSQISDASIGVVIPFGKATSHRLKSTGDSGICASIGVEDFTIKSVNVGMTDKRGTLSCRLVLARSWEFQ